MYKRRTAVVLLFFLFTYGNCFYLSHQINLLGSYNHNQSGDGGEMSLEYYPALEMNIWEVERISLDLQATGEFFAEGKVENREWDKDTEVDFYRLWLRSTTEQSELRLGLQKINFGPAVYLRSLQWFDNLNPYDQRQISKGVWSVLARYYLPDNSNFWFWGIYSDDSIPAISEISSAEGSIQPGARLQLPLLGGELGFCYHSRQIEAADSMQTFPEGDEVRYGLDGRWDIGIGLWYEAMLMEYDTTFGKNYLESYTAGADYTIDWANGIHLLAEAMFTCGGEDYLDSKSRYEQLYLLAADTSLGLYSSIFGVCLWNSFNEEFYFNASYGLTFDYWKINLNLSYYPEDNNEDLENLGFKNGSTAQVILQFNY